MRRRFRFVISTLLGTALLVSCSSNSRNTGFTAPPEPAPTLVGDAGLEAPDADTTCTTKQQQAEPVTLAMVVLIDRSGSMAGEKWEAAAKAIRVFADRAEVVGMKMGLQFFPPISGTSECTSPDFKNLAVPIGPLPDNVIPIHQKLATATVSGGTPMAPGLSGSVEALRSFIAADPMHQGVVILVTDGQPSPCGSVADVAAVAADGMTPTGGRPSIRTFTVGMTGATFSALDQIATSGGTTKSFNVGAGVAAQRALLRAFDEIRAGVIACEYTLPLPPPGEGILDLNKVDLEFNPGGNEPKESIRKVENAEACGAKSGGFYYDAPQTPTKIILCPASCAAVRGGAVDAKVDLTFGCIKKPN
jgi:uncharacterized protein YegL